MADRRVERLGGLRDAMAGAGSDGFLVTSLPNVSYLTGFTGSSGFVLATAERALFLTDSRYQTQSKEEVEGYEVVIQKGKWTDEVAALVREAGIKKLSFEGRALTFDTHAALSKALEGV